MAGRRRPKQEAVIPTTALVASAVRYPGNAARIYTPSQQWQQEAYRHYSICGEARFAANYYGHALGKASLYAALTSPDGLERAASDSVAAQVLAQLFNGPDGQAQMLTSIGIHLTIAGECYLVGRSRTGDLTRDRGALPSSSDDDADIWEVVSTLEMKVTGNKWTISYGDGMADVPLTDNDVVIRIWRPNPARRIEADSPFRSLLPILSEIEWLTRHIFAQASSRLAGAGVLFLPQDMTFPPPPEVDGKPQQTANDADSFMLTLAEAMLEPVQDPGSPSALVPIVVTAPSDSIDKARLMHFWSEMDAASQEMRNGAIYRFALGMDLPPEQIMGMSSNPGTGGGNSNGVSHWGAWQIEEATIKLHIEPMLEIIVNALTIGYLRPATEGNEVVAYDTSALHLRPDRSREAMELYDRGSLKEEVMLRENGFNPKADLPTDEERQAWLLRKVASGSATPDQVHAALKALGVDLGPVADPEPDLAPVEQMPREARPDPSLDGHPDRPRTPAVTSALLVACDALTYRALERAGNRLRQNFGKPVNCPSYETHTLVKANGTAKSVLQDAFSCAAQVLDGIADPDEVVPVLDAYCHTLLTEQSPHERDRLAAWLEKGLA